VSGLKLARVSAKVLGFVTRRGLELALEMALHLGSVLAHEKAAVWALKWATESDRKSPLVWETSTGQVWARAWAERLVVLLEEELVQRLELELELMDEGWDSTWEGASVERRVLVLELLLEKGLVRMTGKGLGRMLALRSKMGHWMG
jgi:hypothetical protein